jgi:hypothetical protein
MPAGPDLAAVLASVDRQALSGKDKVRLLRARHRLVAHLQGELYADMYAISQEELPRGPDATPPGEEPEEYPWATAEIAFALRWTHTAASVRLDQARRMLEDLPAVHAALSAGEIDVPKALLLCDAVGMLELPAARQIVDKLIDKAPGWTTGQLRAKLRRLVIAAEPLAALKRAKQDVKGRRVEVECGDNHLASIRGADLAPHRVAAGWERLTAIARAAKAAGDSRKIDQLRADALLDLLVGEGIAAGGPITSGDLPKAPPASDTPVDEPQFDTPWPVAPADLRLLDADKEPSAPVSPPADDDAVPADLPARMDAGADVEQERLRQFWLAGFDQLSTTRPPIRTGSAGGAMPAPRRGVIDLQVSLETLMGLDELPAELAGYGPLLADIARQVVEQRPDLQWRFSVYDRVDKLVAHGISRVRPARRPPANGRRTKRRPTAEVAALVRARNRSCVAPGCRVPSWRCELDHTLAWVQDGESEPDNLGPACPRHHQLKHSRGCELIQVSPGTFGWQTPLGMQYLTTPDPPLYEDKRYLGPRQADSA